MGWRPEDVRGVTLSDFNAAFEGYQLANGIDTGPDVSDEAMKDLDDLMTRYPGREAA